MSFISVKNLLPEMILAEDVVTNSQNKVLSEGTALTSKDIARLVFYGIEEVEIEDSGSPVPQPEASAPKTLTFSERVKESPEFKEFKKDFEDCANKFEDDINDFIENK